MIVGERGRQFHFGGDNDAANRWHDKLLQFVVCSNDFSATLGEHTMLDAMTLKQLNDFIDTVISSHAEAGGLVPPVTAPVTPVPLSFTTDATIETLIDKVRVQYTDSTEGAEHVAFNFEGYGSKLLREQKLPPKSVFQIVVQLAAYAIFGEIAPCFESVNQAHYHKGRVDIIQVVNPQVVAFLTAARDLSVDMSECRSLLLNAARAHVASVSKVARNVGWERNLTALRSLLQKGEPLPALFEDLVYKRVRPRLMMINCFETGMLKKGCMWRAPESVWMHYEVYDERYVWLLLLMPHFAVLRLRGDANDGKQSSFHICDFGTWSRNAILSSCERSR